MMRRLLAGLSVVGVILLGGAPPVSAQEEEAAYLPERITGFHVTATVSSDRTATFSEWIAYDFGGNERHGIYRYIPVSYDRRGATYKLRLAVTTVERNGKEEEYDESTSDGVLNLKIGDPDVTMTGAHVYAIGYRTNRALNFFPDQDELYWNVTGNGWQVPIEQASFRLALPEGLNPASVKTTCFTGIYGSIEQACSVETEADELVFSTTRVLDPSEGLTVVIGFPKGVIAEPTFLDRTWELFRDNGILLVPLIAFGVMYWRWRTRGRDPELGAIIPEYEPPEKLTPAMVGAAMTDGEVPPRTVTATIIDLARRGYLNIRFGEVAGLFGSKQTFTFVKHKDADKELEPYELFILRGLFKGGDEQTMSQLKREKFYEAVAAFKTNVQKSVDRLDIFDAKPNQTRTTYIIIGVLLIWGILFFFSSTGVGALSAFLTGLIVAVFGWFMPRRNQKGAKLLAAIKGFKWFLSVTEKDRMDFHNAPERTPEEFQALLPYAIVFGVEKKWAEQFASLHVPPPDWAEGALSSMGAAAFASELGHLHSDATSSAYAAPSSSGSGGSGFSGGGSGGGGGGGGGGSW
ncbi:DUF2207 domain-containing protein [Candidatus Uhrbacteria bacterium]|nr:DUF2207 domain-containing protein [Candidatus Uhrbacteria bacterium]